MRSISFETNLTETHVGTCNWIFEISHLSYTTVEHDIFSRNMEKQSVKEQFNMNTEVWQ